MSEEPLTRWEREDLDPWVAIRVVDGSAAPAGYAAMTTAGAVKVLAITRLRLRARGRDGGRFTCDVPGREPEALAHLEDGGLPRVGAEIQPGGVVVGIVRPSAASARTEEPLDASLGALFGTDLEVEDDSITLPGPSAAVVLSASFDGDAALVELERRRPLAIGDAVEAGGRLVRVARLVDALPEDADLCVEGLDGMHRARLTRAADEELRGRAIGPYDPVTEQPVEGRRGGVVLNSPRIHALLMAGAHHALGEMLSLKSDDPEGRVELYTYQVGGPRPTPAHPRAASSLQHDLLRLGFKAPLEADRIEVRLLDAFERQHAAEPLPCPVLHPLAIPQTAARLGLSNARIMATLYDGQRLDGQTADVWTECGASAIAAALERQPDPAARALVFRSWPRMPPAAMAAEPRSDLSRRVTQRFRLLDRQAAATGRAIADLDRPDSVKVRACAALQRALDALVRDADGPGLLAMTDQKLRRKVVDYAGRGAVIGRRDIPEATVRLPRSLAATLWRPQVYGRLEEDGDASRIREAKALVEADTPSARAALEAVTAGYPVLLFLGRGLSLIARRVELWDVDAIGLDPVAARATGELGQAEVHVPITRAARLETDALVERLAPTADLPGYVPEGWIARAAWGGPLGTMLLRAALGEEVDPVTDPFTRAFLGRPG